MPATNSVGADIQAFLPIKEIKNGEITYVTNKKARIIKVGSINLAFLSLDEQRFKINQFASLLRGVSYDASIIKLERPMDLSSFIERQKKLYKKLEEKFTEGLIDKDSLKRRKDQLDYENSLLGSLNDENPMYINEFYFAIYGDNSEELNHIYKNSLMKFSQLKLTPYEMDDNQIKLFLHNFYNPLKRVDKDYFKNIEDYKAEIMPQKLSFNSRKVLTESMDACIWGLHEYPVNVPGGWLAHAVNSSNTTCVINLKPVTTVTAKKMMDKAITEIRTQMLNKSTASESESKMVQLETFQTIISDIERGNETLKLVNVLVMNYAEDDSKLRDVRRKTKANLRQNNFKIDELPFRQQQGLIAMIPTPRDEIIEFNGRDIPSITVAASFPFMFQSLEDKDGFLLGYNNSSLIFWDPKVRSPARTNSNVMVIGKSGSGKSHFTKKMFLKMILEGIKIYIVDPEGEYNVMSKKMGGEKIDVGAGYKSRINPFHIFGQMEGSDEKDDDLDLEFERIQGLKSTFSMQVQFMEQFFKNLIPDLTDKEVSRISKLIIETYNKKNINDETNFEQLKKEDYPIMDDLLSLIEEKIRELSDIIIKDKNRTVDLGDEVSDLRSLKVYVERMASGGSLASLWNGPTTIETSNSDFIHFDFKRMNSSKNERVMNAQMMLVLRFLESEVSKNRERNLSRKENNHIAIAVDEAHLFIDDRSPAALYFMFQMIKRIRKYNGIFVVITQNVNDFVGSDHIKKYTTAIVNGC